MYGNVKRNKKAHAYYHCSSEKAIKRGEDFSLGLVIPDTTL